MKGHWRDWKLIKWFLIFDFPNGPGATIYFDELVIL